jgi:hypothetical protein
MVGFPVHVDPNGPPEISVNGPPAVVSTKKRKISPGCTEPMSASVMLVVVSTAVTECGETISQSGSVHGGVAVPFIPRPLSAKVLVGGAGGLLVKGFSVRLAFPVLGAGPAEKPLE